MDTPFHIVISNVLSVCTIAICFVSKIPQIQIILSNGSAKGLSVSSVGIEILRYTIMWLYNYCFGYPLLSFLEFPILLIQQTILLYLVLKYNQQICIEIILFGLLLVITIVLFMTATLPRIILAFLIPLCPVAAATSRIMQLLRILRSRNADNISLSSWAMTVFAGFSRCYTVLIATGDKMLFLNSIISFTSSASVLVSALYFKKTVKQIE